MPTRRISFTTSLVIYDALSRPLFGASLAYIMFCCAAGRAPRTSSLLNRPAWRPIAGLSYSMYMLQFVTGRIFLQPVHKFLIGTLSSDASLPLAALVIYTDIVLFILASIPLALLNYVLVERPGISAGRHLLQLIKGRPAPSSAKESKDGLNVEVDGASVSKGDLEANADEASVSTDDFDVDGEASVSTDDFGANASVSTGVAESRAWEARDGLAHVDV